MTADETRIDGAEPADLKKAALEKASLEKANPEKASPEKATKGSTVSRVLDILDAVAQAERPMSPADLADQLGIPKASLHRLVSTLESHGFLQTRMSGRGVQPGHKLHQMALGVLASAPFQAQRRAILSALSERIGETCNISVPDGAEMIYYDRAETHWPVRIQLQIGSRVPACATAGGKMYLSSLSRARRERIVNNTPLTPYTRNTLTDRSVLHRELDRTADRGYALDNEEYIEGMVALAVPVLDDRQRLYATLSFHAPCMRVSFESLTGYLAEVQDASHQLTALLAE